MIEDATSGYLGTLYVAGILSLTQAQATEGHAAEQSMVINIHIRDVLLFSHKKAEPLELCI